MREAPPVPERPLLLLDYDGTLAPIVTDPAAAFPHPEVPGLLQRLAGRHPLFVISGRDLRTLASLLTGADGAPIGVRAVGLHGAEEGVLGRPAARPALDDHAGALRRMRARVPRAPGVVVEDKGGEAFAVHYRTAADPEAVRRELAGWVAHAPAELEPIWGKRVVELRPAGVSKGAAVARIAVDHPGHTAVYIGDDVTDEDAFAALAEAADDVVTIRVGAGETRARYRLPDVASVVRYLHHFDA